MSHPSSSASILEAPSKSVKLRTPKKLALSSFTRQNIGTVKKINGVVLPVTYSDKFYQAALSPELEDYCKIGKLNGIAAFRHELRLGSTAVVKGFYNDIPVGALACKFEQEDAPETRLYVATLCVLAPYRHQGVGSLLLKNLMERAEASGSKTPPTRREDSYPILSDASKDKKGAKPTAQPQKKIKSIYLHVHTANEEAKAFWEHSGFKVVSTKEEYFTKLDIRSAWVMEREIQHETS